MILFDLVTDSADVSDFAITRSDTDDLKQKSGTLIVLDIDIASLENKNENEKFKDLCRVLST